MRSGFVIEVASGVNREQCEGSDSDDWIEMDRVTCSMSPRK